MNNLNKKGMSLVSMLAITLFLIAAVGTALAFVVNDALQVKKTVEDSTEIPSAVNAVDASVAVLRDLWLSQSQIDETDPVWSTLGVTLTIEDEGKTFRISREVGDKIVYSIIQVTSGGSTGFAFQVTKAHISDPNMKVGPLLHRFITKVFGSSSASSDYAWIMHNLTTRTDVNYYKPTANSVRGNTTFTSHTLISGSVNPNNNATWTIPDGKVVIVTGSMSTGNNFSIQGGGTLIVGGSLSFANNARIEGSVFSGGAISINNNFELGYLDMGFMFGVGPININNNTYFTGFIISDSTVTIRNNSDLTGGVYAHGEVPSIGQNKVPQPLPDSMISNDSTTGLVLVDAQTDGVEVDISIVSTRPNVVKNPNYNANENATNKENNANENANKDNSSE